MEEMKKKPGPKKGQKQIIRTPGGAIEPLRAYNAEQVSELFGVHPKLIYSLTKELHSKKVGRQILILGENILAYLRSTTYIPRDTVFREEGLFDLLLQKPQEIDKIKRWKK